MPFEEFEDQPEALAGPVFPPGPALLYVPSDSGPLVRLEQTTWRVDTGRITEGGVLSADDARRERKLLRALLDQALYLLGPEEDEG